MAPRLRMCLKALPLLLLALFLSGAHTVLAQSANPLLIAEFRTRGPNGKFDEFVKIYNNSDAPFTVQTADNSAGFALVALSGSPNSLNLQHRFTIPNGTVIQPRGYFLGVIPITGQSTQGYSLDSYSQADATYGTDIDDDRGIALFNTADINSWTLANRIDAVGFNGSSQSAAQLAREGTPLASPGNANGEYSWVRKLNLFTGRPVDTNDNAADFHFISTTGGTFGGVVSVLGMPGPQNRNDPNERNATITGTLIPDASSPTGFRLNVRDTADTGPNKTFGTLTIFRRFKNEGSDTIKLLRFRIYEITTRNSPLVCGTRCPQSDVRYLDSGVVPSGGPKGTQVDNRVAQPMGGGINASSTFGGVIDLGADPLAPGASIDVQFVLGVVERGYYRFFVNIEGKPAPPSSPASEESDEIAPQPVATTSSRTSRRGR